MNKSTGIIIGVIALVVIVGGAYAFMNSNDSVMAKDTVEEGGEMMKKEEVGMEKGIEQSDGMVKSGLYEAYAPEKLARAEAGDVVLFFHASWCPSCRGLNADIEKNVSAVPAGVTILKTDYDKETELKKKYGVTYQHTLVQVDKDGNLIKKWSGSPTLSALVSEIN
ncbi:MAG: thioredoxin family protein [Candidatus Paceibacterota bacterium]